MRGESPALIEFLEDLPGLVPQMDNGPDIPRFKGGEGHPRPGRKFAIRGGNRIPVGIVEGMAQPRGKGFPILR